MDFPLSLHTYFVVFLHSATCIDVGQLVAKHRETRFLNGHGNSISWKLPDNVVEEGTTTTTFKRTLKYSVTETVAAELQQVRGRRAIKIIFDLDPHF